MVSHPCLYLERLKKNLPLIPHHLQWEALKFAFFAGWGLFQQAAGSLSHQEEEPHAGPNLGHPASPTLFSPNYSVNNNTGKISQDTNYGAQMCKGYRMINGKCRTRCVISCNLSGC